MSIKFNWGHGLTIALAIFVLFIGSFVYKTFFDSRYSHSLVSEEYYKEELYYQEEIDKLNNANALKQNVVVNSTNKGFELVFPDNFDFKKIKGNVVLQKPSDKEFDYETVIKLDSAIFLIPDKFLVKGLYNIKLSWEYDDTSYLLKEKITY